MINQDAFDPHLPKPAEFRPFRVAGRSRKQLWHQVLQFRRGGDGIGVVGDRHARTRVEPGEANYGVVSGRERQQIAAAEPSGKALETAFAGRAGQQTDHGSDDAGDALRLRGAEFNSNAAAFRDAVRIETAERLQSHQVGARHRGAGMPGELDRIDVAVFDAPVIGGAEEFGEGVVQRDAGNRIEERWVAQDGFPFWMIWACTSAATACSMNHSSVAAPSSSPHSRPSPATMPLMPNSMARAPP